MKLAKISPTAVHSLDVALLKFLFDLMWPMILASTEKVTAEIFLFLFFFLPDEPSATI